MRLTADLILTALHRAGRPQAAGDLFELAQLEAIDAGASRQEVTGWSRKGMGSMLRNLRLRGDVETVGEAHTDGERILSSGVLFQPVGGVFERDRPLPDPDPPAGQHPLDTLTRPHQLVVFDASSDALAEAQRIIADAIDEQMQVARRMCNRLVALQRDVRTRLAAHDLDVD